MSESGPMAKLVRKKKWSDGRTGPVAGHSDRLTGTVQKMEKQGFWQRFCKILESFLSALMGFLQDFGRGYENSVSCQPLHYNIIQ